MRIDQNTAQGQALQKRVQTQLKEYLGTDYADDVLPLYIVVMLAHGNDQSQVAENLDAFLGAEDAGRFATWLFAMLAEQGGHYSAPEPESAAKAVTSNQDNKAGGAEEPVERHMEEPKAEEKSEGHNERERHRQAIEWRGEGASRHRSERPPREEKRHRDEPRSERHGSQREPDAEAGREEKRARRSLRELRPLDVPHGERRRDREREREREPHRGRHEDGARHHGERERPADWERQARRGGERERDWEREAAWERERSVRARPLPDLRDPPPRERERGMYMDRERDWELQRERERERDVRRPPRDAPAQDPGRGQAPHLQDPDWRRRERDLPPMRVEGNGTHHPSAVELSPAAEDKDNGALRGADGRGPAHADRGDTAAARSTVFDRLGQIRERALDESAAARKSVFDRLRGNRRPSAQERVDPEAETDEEGDALPGQAAQHDARALPRLAAGTLASKALTGIRALPVQDKKTEDLADMKRKMAELQAQVQRLEREASSGGAKGLNASALAFQPAMVAVPAAAALHGMSGLGLPGPAVDPRSVHVQGVSPLAVPEVIGAHFSGCGLVINVTIARDMQGVPRGFCHVEFSNELEAQIALSLSGSILMSQPITVTPKILRPALPMAPGGFARGRGGFPSPGFSGGRGAPFAAPSTGRGRGRMDRPLSSHKYVRPEFKAQMDRQKAGIGPPAP